MSDITDRNIILILVTGFYLYLYYIKGILKAKQDLKYYRCNPVNLFLQSIHADEDVGVKQFQTCVNELNTSKR
jgi:hypothetical protein